MTQEGEQFNNPNEMASMFSMDAPSEGFDIEEDFSPQEDAKPTEEEVQMQEVEVQEEVLAQEAVLEEQTVVEEPQEIAQEAVVEEVQAPIEVQAVEEPKKDWKEQTPKIGSPVPLGENLDMVTVSPVEFSSFDDEETILSENPKKNLDIVQDVKMHITVELGRARCSVKKILDFQKGSIVELNKVAGEQVELYANGKFVAYGEVIVIEDKFGLRVTSIAHKPKAN